MPVTTAGQYGLLACYGDDPTTSVDEGARPEHTVRLVVDGQELGTGTWTANGRRQWAPLGAVRLWRVWLPVGAVVRAYDPTGVLAGRAEVALSGWYLVSVYGDDPTTHEDEGARASDTIRLVVDGQELGTGTWTANGRRQWVLLGAVELWRVWLPLVQR